MYIMNSFLTPTISGDWIHIFNPNFSNFPDRLLKKTKGKWYTNDHTIVKGPDGLWHGFGIIGYKRFGLPWSWKIEKQLFHISSPLLTAEKWEEHDYAIHADRSVGELYTWAPHTIVIDQKWYMFYAVGTLRPLSFLLPSVGKIHMATSLDGTEWIRHAENPIVMDWGYARDPMVFQKGDTFYLYYTTNRSDNDFHSSVAVRKSKDLIHWTGPRNVHTQPNKKGWFAGNAESPFVVEKDGLFYLFACVALDDYHRTSVYWSRTPESFPLENHVCNLPTHASEIIYDEEQQKWFITNTGWDKKGLFIAPLQWK
jgi:hypothetical protein